MSATEPSTLAPPRAGGVPVTASVTFPRHPVRALVHAWLILDFFADTRRTGQPSSSLTATIFGQAFMAVAFAALLFPDTPPGAFAAANLSLSSLLVGIGHLGDESAEGRARADRALVLTSPLSSRTVLAARALHASFYVCLLTIGMALPPAILLAFLPGQDARAVPLYVLLACLCSGLFTAALALLVRLFARLVGTARAQLAAGTLKALLLFGGLVAFALSAPHLKGAGADSPLPLWLAYAWPPAYAGAVIAGDRAAWLPLLVGLATLTLAALMLATDREVEAARRVRTPRPLAALNRHLCRARPTLHAVTAFTSAMLYRSVGFRGKVLPLFGLPAGMWLLAFLDRDPDKSQRLLALATQLPGVYLPFLIAFLGVGDEPRARWTFAACPHLPPSFLRRGIAIALTTHVLLPVHVVLLLVSMPAIGPARALATSSLALGVSVMVGRLALRTFCDVPFSGTGTGDGLDFGSLITYALALTMIGLGAAALPTIYALPLGLAVLGAAYLDLRRIPSDATTSDPA